MSQPISHFLKIFNVIHAFLLAQYRTGKLSILIPLKQQLLFISPDMFEQHIKLHNPSLSLNQIELHVCSLGNCTVWHNKINLFHRHCIYCHDLGVCHNTWGMDWILCLLTTYTHHSELHVITALLLSTHFTVHCYTHMHAHTLGFSVFTSRILAMDFNTVISPDSL
jgi:hypothetical protein